MRKTTLAALILAASTQAASAFGTLVCSFERSCAAEGACDGKTDAFSLSTTPIIGGRDRATVGYPDNRGKIDAAYDRDIGALHWSDGQFNNAFLFTAASSRVVWTRIAHKSGGAEVLFGTCLDAF